MTDVIIHKYLPPGFEEPTTVLEALKVGRAILAEEGRWCRGTSYKITNPEEDPTTPFCDSWMVCSVGALMVAMIGLVDSRSTRPSGCPDPDCECNSGNPWEVLSFSRVGQETRALYEAATKELTRTTGFDIVVYNDRTDGSFEEVLQVWDDTIARLELTEQSERS